MLNSLVPSVSLNDIINFLEFFIVAFLPKGSSLGEKYEKRLEKLWNANNPLAWNNHEGLVNTNVTFNKNAIFMASS